MYDKKFAKIGMLLLISSGMSLLSIIGYYHLLAAIIIFLSISLIIGFCVTMYGFFGLLIK